VTNTVKEDLLMMSLVRNYE